MTISNALVKTTEADITVPKYFFGVSAIQVQSDREYRRLAFFGDSLTNQGNFSAPLSLSLESKFNLMTANYGLSGNRLLRPGHSTSQWSTSFGEAGLIRFDNMLVDYQPNIVIFLEGINDLFHPGTGSPMSELPTADNILEAIYLLKRKCKQYDITFVPMTITPANGNTAGWSDEKEKIRLDINTGLRAMPHVIDLDNLTSEDDKLASNFDCGDHIHFSAEGGQIIAKHIKEQLIRKKMI